jgi:hypothetical protein
MGLVVDFWLMPMVWMHLKDVENIKALMRAINISIK